MVMSHLERFWVKPLTNRYFRLCFMVISRFDRFWVKPLTSVKSAVTNGNSGHQTPHQQRTKEIKEYSKASFKIKLQEAEFAFLLTPLTTFCLSLFTERTTSITNWPGKLNKQCLGNKNTCMRNLCFNRPFYSQTRFWEDKYAK